ncbi:MAG: Holliday junction branch migration protein RuvA [Gemmatimonadaceae bacterium]
MISRIVGTLLAKELDRVEIMTSGGVGYDLSVPLSVFEMTSRVGDAIELHTHLVVREDGWQLFGFATNFDRQVFMRVLNAKGVGPSLALGLLSTLSGSRLVQALRDHDIPTLQSVPRVGRKKAEQMILDLADKLDDLLVPGATAGPRPQGAQADDAIRALVSLGYSTNDADRAVRTALDEDGKGLAAADLIRRALAKVSR